MKGNFKYVIRFSSILFISFFHTQFQTQSNWANVFEGIGYHVQECIWLLKVTCFSLVRIWFFFFADAMAIRLEKSSRKIVIFLTMTVTIRPTLLDLMSILCHGVFCIGFLFKKMSEICNKNQKCIFQRSCSIFGSSFPKVPKFKKDTQMACDTKRWGEKISQAV